MWFQRSGKCKEFLNAPEAFKIPLKIKQDCLELFLDTQHEILEIFFFPRALKIIWNGFQNLAPGAPDILKNSFKTKHTEGTLKIR